MPNGINPIQNLSAEIMINHNDAANIAILLYPKQQQGLTELNHPDHTLITYPNLGHLFYPSSQWENGIGPIQQYVLADIYSWLEAHSGLSQSFFKLTSASTNIANTSSLNANKTS